MMNMKVKFGHIPAKLREKFQITIPEFRVSLIFHIPTTPIWVINVPKRPSSGRMLYRHCPANLVTTLFWSHRTFSAL
jgi:hypothetical protein